MFALLWLVALLLAAAQLLFYREPEGVYEAGEHGARSWKIDNSVLDHYNILNI